MLRWSANLTFLFQEYPFLERFEQAARAGFGVVEFAWPRGEPLDEVVAAQRAHQLDVAMVNIDAGDLAQGERGHPHDPAKREWWRERFLAALDLAVQLKTPRLTVLAGNAPPGLTREQMLDCLMENLAWASPQAEAQGKLLQIEPQNPHDNPRYLLTRVEDVREVIERVGRPNIKIEFDVYHVQRGQGDLTRRLTKMAPFISHIQIADSPGRMHPGTGEINFPFVFQQIEALPYDGYVGLEYNTGPSTLKALEWLPREKRKG